MGQVILIRHGQANRAGTTEEEYDRLSDLGAEQSRLLGDALRAQGIKPDRMLRGSLRRHVATADNIGDLGVAIEEDPRLNEMDYLTLGRALEDDHGVPQPGPENFIEHFVQVMHAWKDAQIHGQESFDSFETRVAGVLKDAQKQGQTVVCVTSGGVIAMMIRHLLRLDIPAMARVATPIWNTSVHRIDVAPHGAMLSAFNQMPHLELPEHARLRTHY